MIMKNILITKIKSFTANMMMKRYMRANLMAMGMDIYLQSKVYWKNSSRVVFYLLVVFLPPLLLIFPLSIRTFPHRCNVITMVQILSDNQYREEKVGLVR